jgi:hypothetical protein
LLKRQLAERLPFAAADAHENLVRKFCFRVADASERIGCMTYCIGGVQEPGGVSEYACCSDAAFEFGKFAVQSLVPAGDNYLSDRGDRPKQSRLGGASTLTARCSCAAKRRVRSAPAGENAATASNAPANPSSASVYS